MSIVPVQKIAVVCSKDQKEKLLKWLEKKSLLEVIENSQDNKNVLQTPPDIDHALSQLNGAIEFLSAYTKKKGLIASLANPKDVISLAVYDQNVAEFDHKPIVEEIRQLEMQLRNALNFEARTKNDIKMLLPWIGLDIGLEEFVCSRKSCLFLASVKSKSFDEFKKALQADTKYVDVEVILRTNNQGFLAIIYLAQEKQALDRIMAEHSVETVNLPALKATPAQEVENLKQHLIKNQEEIDAINKKLQELERYLVPLKCLYDYYYAGKNLLLNKGKLLDLKYSFVLVGWVKQTDLKKLSLGLAKEFNSQVLIRGIALEEGEVEPIAIDNPWFLKPFETITRIFGLPNHGEFDPTLALSLFFIVFFGICLGDVAYGLFLTLFCLWLKWKFKLTVGGQGLINLMALGGIVSVVVGFFTGSWFGNVYQYLPAYFAPFKNFALSLQKIDLIKQPLQFLVFSLALGVIQIVVGQGMKLWANIYFKRFNTAVLDDIPWLVYLVGLVSFVVAFAIKSPFAVIFRNMAIIGAVALVLTQGRSQKNISMKAILGILSLYRTTGYLGDVLSYSRLLALGMSTGIIAMVVNILASMTASTPVVGFVFMVLIFIVGHIFNLAVSTLSAFVHPTRLQLVEFFSKFFEGGGKEFRPFKKETRYLQIE